MTFADLHIHSHFSRATARDLTIPVIAGWAMKKGLGLVGTGDVTHPGWLAEVRESLEDVGGGLLAMKAAVASEVKSRVPASARAEVRFILSVEVSSIFKKGGRIRKVHSVVFLPSLASAERFSTALSRLGNVTSDGRPILGLPPMTILSLARNASPDSFMIPAHVWTPHFSLFGANSGFDAIEECFEDLSGEIFALETGLSSDPAMNRRWSALDRFSLVSCSDAHSPAKLGREATVLEGPVDFGGLVSALKGRGGLQGTVEFFPEEGKYHFDGHRKCGVRTGPEETSRLAGRCPACGGRLTPGVLGRVEALADRRTPAEGFPRQFNLVPLAELIAETLEVGVASRRVDDAYQRVIAEFGPELPLLGWADLARLREAGAGLLAEAIGRVREGRVRLEGGYDGEYGVVSVFGAGEIAALRGQGLMFGLGGDKSSTAAPTPTTSTRPDPEPEPDPEKGSGSGPGAGATLDLFGPVPALPLTPEQQAAATASDTAIAVIAGPGTGKTRTLVQRAVHLVRSGIQPGGILVLTFTNRAAGEARERLAGALGHGPVVTTFHAFALAELSAIAVASGRSAPRVVPRDSASPPGEGEIGLDDLVPGLVEALKADAGTRERVSTRFAHVLVDEFQDIGPDQYELLSLLRPAGSPVFVVGDPDQAIYGFRGSDPRVFTDFARDRDGARVFRLTETHRLGPEVVSLAGQVVRWGAGSAATLVAKRPPGREIPLYRARNPHDEAGKVVEQVRAIVGGIEMHESTLEGERAGLGDIAVLGRTHAVVDRTARALEEAGFPVERASDRQLTTMEWVAALVAGLADSDEGDCAALACDLLAKAGFRPDARDLKAVLALVRGLGPREAASRLAVLREVDAFGMSPERVQCLTIHAAKGLEFDHVFVVGCEEGVIPLAGPPDGFDEDEERRLFYVAATRARLSLRLSFPVAGGMGSGRLSRFLERLKPGSVQDEDGTAPRRTRGPAQLGLL